MIFLPIQSRYPVFQQLLLPPIVLDPVKEEIDPLDQACII